MTPQLATGASCRSPEATSPDRAAIAQAASSLLAELERSLEAGQRALLSRDLEGLERATCEQIGLNRSLQILRPRQPGESRTGVQANATSEIDCDLAASLRAAQWRVLYLGRVQAALLTRAQRSLRIVSHRLAGPGASYVVPGYARPASNRAASRPAEMGEGKAIQGEEEAGPCRV
jgi:hypothetical protein